MRKQMWKRVVACLLTVFMLFSTVSNDAYAYYVKNNDGIIIPNAPSDVVLKTQDGDVYYDESWTNAYPFGTFAFGTYDVSVSENGAVVDSLGNVIPKTVTVPVYRLGGTVGKAEVNIQYMPVVTASKDDTLMFYDYALSASKDVEIKYENALPIAQYQKYGIRDIQTDYDNYYVEWEPEDMSLYYNPAPVTPDTPIKLYLTDYFGMGADTDSCQWQIWTAETGWTDIEGATDTELKATLGDIFEDFETYTPAGNDFRCIYSTGGEYFCTLSFVYYMEYEDINESVDTDIPADLELDPEPSYTCMCDAQDADEDPFYGYNFTLTFAEGEWVKNIVITGLEDAEAEFDEMGLLTIVGCTGGELSNYCDTLTVSAANSNPHFASEIGFDVSSVTYDQDDAIAYVTVKRTGDTTYPVNVAYETVDGTALAGKQYTAAKGTAMLSGSQNEVTLAIPLIAEKERAEALTFKVVLGELQGGLNGLCTLNENCSETEISLTCGGVRYANALGEQEDAKDDLVVPADLNVSTVLANAGGEDISGNVVMNGSSLIPKAETIIAQSAGSDSQNGAVKGVYDGESAVGGVALLSFSAGRVNFSRSNYLKNFWTDYEIVAGYEREYYNVNSGSIHFAPGAAQTPEEYFSEATHNLNPTAYVVTRAPEMRVENNYFNVDTVSEKPVLGLRFISDKTTAGAELRFDKANYLYKNYEISGDWTSVGGHFDVTLGSFFSDKWFINPTAVFYTSTGDKSEQQGVVQFTKNTNMPWYGNSCNVRIDKPLSMHSNGTADSVSIKVKMDMMEDPKEDNGYHGHSPSNDAKVDSASIYTVDTIEFVRRPFTKAGIDVNLYTANDADTGSLVKLDADSMLYKQLKPEVSIVKNKGGVNKSGALYVGSQLLVKVPRISGYRMQNLAAGSTGCYVVGTAANGTKKKIPATVELSEQPDAYYYYVTLLWDGMTDSDINLDFSLNLIYERTQSITVNVAGNVGSDGRGVTLADAWNLVAKNGASSRKIKIGNSKLEWKDTSCDTTATATDNLDFYNLALTAVGNSTSMLGNSGAVTLFDAGSINAKNVQYINFGQDAEDLIIFNGKAYAGDADIYLDENDFYRSNLTFNIYDSSCLDAVSTMVASIDHVEIYLDDNYNGKIDGTFNSASGSFTPSGDKLLGILTEEEYMDEKFKPVVLRTLDADGNETDRKVKQYFFKIYYSMNPRSLNVPIGGDASDRAQIIPGIVTGATGEEALAALTEEEKAIRYVNGGDSMNGHIMYGAAATALNYVDMPLGGDAGTVEVVSEIVLSEETKIESKVNSYVWKPNYIGNLIEEYGNPTPVINENNISGKSVAVAGESAKVSTLDGINYEYSADGLKKINGYLGSFTGNSRFIIAVQQQKVSGLQYNSQINPESFTLGSIHSLPTPADVTSSMSGTSSDTDAAAPDEAAGYPEYTPDFGIELPGAEFGFGDYFSISMEGSSITLTAGLPVASVSKTSYSSTRAAADKLNQTARTDGLKVKDRKTDGKQETLELVDPNDPTKTRTVTTTKGDPATTDNADGTKTTKTSDNVTTKTSKGNEETVSTTTTEKRNSEGKVVEKTVEKITTTTVVDAQGNKSTTRVKSTTTYGRDENGVVDESRSRTRNTANVSAADAQNAFKSGLASEEDNNAFQEANGGGQTARDFFKAIGAGKLREFNKSMLNDDSLNQAKNGSNIMKKFSVTVTVRIAITLEYNLLADAIVFSEAALSVELMCTFTVQARLVACPIVYTYFKLSFGVTVGASLAVEYTPEIGDAIPVSSFANGVSKIDVGSLGNTITFELDVENNRGFVMNLQDSVYMEVSAAADFSGDLLVSGLVKGTGITLDTEVLLDDYDLTKLYVKLTALKSSSAVRNLRTIKGSDWEVHFNGLTLAPQISIELGVGAGIECLKVEGYAKVNVAIVLTFLQYVDEAQDNVPFQMSSFDFGISLGLRATMLFFNFEMDLIGFYTHGETNPTNWKETEWTLSASALGQNYTLWEKKFKRDLETGTVTEITDGPAGLSVLSLSQADYAELAKAAQEEAAAEGGLVSVKGPSDNSSELTFNSLADKKTGISPYALMPTDNDVKFQLSGYNTSGDAKMLAEGFNSGYSYKLFKVGADNYIVYPVPDTVGGETVTRLVMSKLVMDGDPVTGEMYGLQNPSDPSDTTVYIPVDSDDTSDLEFAVSAQGSNIIVSWTSYYSKNSYGTDKFTEAAKDTVVKRASFDTANPSSGFTAPDIISGVKAAAPAEAEVGVMRSTPVGLEGLTFFTQSSGGTGEAANNLLKAYEKAVNGLSDAELTSGVADTGNPLHASYVYYWLTQSNLNKLYGNSTELVAVNADGTINKVDVSMSAVDGLSSTEVIQSIDAANVSGSGIVVSYTTAQTAYFNISNGASLSVNDPSNINANTEKGTTYRLYTRTYDPSSGTFGEAKILQTLIDYDQCDSDNIDAPGRLLKDGIYSAGILKKAQADPYFSNIHFIDADISGAGKETVLLYEMGGNTYMVDETSISHIFNGGDVNVTAVFSDTTGTNVTVGSDSEGNMAVVYTAVMDGTQNNALWIAWWDKELKEWGSGIALAMNHLQVYEDSSKYDLSPDELTNAYLGKRTGNEEYDKYIESASAWSKGDMTQLVFSNIQMTTRKVRSGDAEKEELVVLTEGAYSELKSLYSAAKEHYTPADPYVVVADPATTRTGFYAVSFGNGEQKLDNFKFVLSNYNLKAGDKVSGKLSFVNTGTASVRSSDTNPVTAELYAKAPGSSATKLNSWYITESFGSGTSIELDFTSEKLTEDLLKEGTEFYAIISEDAAYITSTGGTPFSCTTQTLLKLGAKPELMIDNFDVTLLRIETNPETGEKCAVLSLDSKVSNIGSAVADDVFVQFTYNTGDMDRAGFPVYKPVDLRGSSLETSEQRPIQTLALAPTVDQLQYGIVALKKDSSDNQKLAPGYYRTVSADEGNGIMYVPLGCFIEKENLSGLRLRMEVFSAADSLTINNNVYSAVHGEFDSYNNTANAAIQQKTLYAVSNQVNIALGNTVNVVVESESTSKKSKIVAREVLNGEHSEPMLGVLYYKDGVIVAAANQNAKDAVDNSPEKRVRGMIRLEDAATNSIENIAFTISEIQTGINIAPDDESFRFFNADDTAVNFKAAETLRDWSYGENYFAWLNDSLEAPLNNDVVRAKKVGAYVIFDTVADSMDIRYSGDIEVTDPDGLFTPVAADTDANTKHIEFNNVLNKRHKVKITAKQMDTMLDSYTEAYSAGSNPIPSYSQNAPVIYYDRSFPSTGSLLSTDKGGTPVTVKCYTIAKNGVSHVELDGKDIKDASLSSVISNISDAEGDSIWSFDLQVSQNTDAEGMTVTAFDASGRYSSSKIIVDWFNDVPAGSTEVPALRESDLSFDTTGTPSLLKSNYSAGANETVNAYYSADALFGSVPLTNNANTWDAAIDGYYLVRAEKTNAQGAVIGWRQVVVKLEQSARSGLVLVASSQDRVISITVQADDQIASVRVNGYELEAAIGQTFFFTNYNVPLGGSYTIEAVNTLYDPSDASDTVNRKVEVLTVASEPIVNERLLSGSKNKISVSKNAIAGGVYDPALSNTNGGNPVNYSTEYYAVMVPYDTLAENAVLTGITAGDYVQIPTSGTADFRLTTTGAFCLVVKDKADNSSTKSFTVSEITVPAASEYTIAGLESGLYASGTVVNFSVNPASGFSKADTFTVTVNGAEIPANSDGSFTYTVTGSDAVIAVNGITDTSAPEAVVSIGGRTFTGFAAASGFDCAIRSSDKADVTITDPSGVASAGYYISEVILAKVEVENISLSNWTALTLSGTSERKTGVVDLGDSEKKILYIRVTDSNGNVGVYGTAGLIIRNEVPGGGSYVPIIWPEQPADDKKDDVKDDTKDDIPEVTPAVTPAPVLDIKKGDVIADKELKAEFKVTSTKKKEVEYESSSAKKATTVTVPDTVVINGEEYKVTKIASGAFKNNTKLKKIVIGNNVTSIGSKAFYKATSLKTVKLGKNVKTIGSYAFYGCSSLTSVTIPKSVTKIGAYAFKGCVKLKTITITSSKLVADNFDKKAFKGIPDSVVFIVPKGKLSEYKKLFRSKGLSKKVVFKEAE